MIKILERLGVPRTLMLGFLAVAIFMTGDGFELTFLSKFMVDQGFTSSQASLLVTGTACSLPSAEGRQVCLPKCSAHVRS